MPETAAGRALHRMLFGEWDNVTDGPKRMNESTIEAIEAEARALGRAEALADPDSIRVFGLTLRQIDHVIAVHQMHEPNCAALTPEKEMPHA